MIRGLDSGDVEMETDLDKIETVRRKWISVVNITADDMKEKRRSRGSRVISTEELFNIKKMLKFFKEDIIEADDNVAVEVEEEFHRKRENILVQNKSKIGFKEGTLSPDVVEKMFGDIVNLSTQAMVKVTEISHFIHIDESDLIRRIVPLINDEALMIRSEDKNIYHVDKTGKVIKKLPGYSGNFIILDDYIVFSVFGQKIIRRFAMSGIENDLCSTSPLYPRGICKSYDRGVLVALCSCLSTEITSDSYGEVHHFDTSGVIINRFSHTDDRKSKLFICPNRLAQNKNTDLCVVDNTDKNFKSRLVVVSLSSQIKFIYTGQPDLTEMFICSDVACDHRCRILITDVPNHAVHLLRQDGHFLQYVLTERSPLRGPQSIGQQGETLWVGCSEALVRVYEYKD